MHINPPRELTAPSLSCLCLSLSTDAQSKIGQLSPTQPNPVSRYRDSSRLKDGVGSGREREKKGERKERERESTRKGERGTKECNNGVCGDSFVKHLLCV